ncbi:three-Cys-motif partner protein TcmP [bacterium]|nr:three-Cys-motif partner protein TcmP [bacterium]
MTPKHPSRPDLHEIFNPGCSRGCNQEDRNKKTYEDVCLSAKSVIDGEDVRCVGEWARRKIFRLWYYFELFANGMKNKWNSLNYIEICSGPGRCIFRDSGREADGTSLAILQHPSFDYIKNAIFIDNNPSIINTLNARIDSLGKHNKACAILGDYQDQEQLRSILSSIEGQGLNLVLIDSTDCSVPFSTIQLIKEALKKADLIINVALYTDVRRNIRTAIIDPEPHKELLEKYGSFLGDSNYLFSEEVKSIAHSGEIKNANNPLTNLFLDKYKEQLCSIGYTQCNSQEKVGEYYRLVYASSDKLGLHFWKEALKPDIDQMKLL